MHTPYYGGPVKLCSRPMCFKQLLTTSVLLKAMTHSILTKQSRGFSYSSAISCSQVGSATRGELGYVMYYVTCMFTVPCDGEFCKQKTLIGR